MRLSGAGQKRETPDRLRETDPMRKPVPGMLLAAARDHGLDLARSWMVGDTVSDMGAGRNAGCRTLLVRTGYGDRVDASAGYVDHAAADLAAAAEVILAAAP